ASPTTQQPAGCGSAESSGRCSSRSAFAEPAGSEGSVTQSGILLPSVLGDLAAGTRSFTNLPGFLRRPVMVAGARTTIQQRLGNREKDFSLWRLGSSTAAPRAPIDDCSTWPAASWVPPDSRLCTGVHDAKSRG